MNNPKLTIPAEQSQAVIEAKNLIARGEQIGPDLTKTLLREQVAKKPKGYIYTDAKGNEATHSGGARCRNVLPKDLDRFDESEFKLVDGLDTPAKQGLEFVPGCIVGSVFADVVPIENLPIAGNARSTNRAAGKPFDSESELILGAAQWRQDDGIPWADAVEEAIKERENV